jgi:hypothetical protein
MDRIVSSLSHLNRGILVPTGSLSQARANDSTAPNDATPGSLAAPFTPPAIIQPRGGGALRGIGEKFSANPVLCENSAETRAPRIGGWTPGEPVVFRRSVEADGLHQRALRA